MSASWVTPDSVPSGLTPDSRARYRPKMEQKQRYERPELVVIDLKAEEVLAVGCKTQSSRAQGSFVQPCWAANCSQKGS